VRAVPPLRAALAAVASADQQSRDIRPRIRHARRAYIARMVI